MLVTIGFLVYFIFFSPDDIRLAGRSFNDLMESGDLVPVIIIPLVLVISGGVVWSFMRTLYPVRIQDGVSAPARVLKVWDTGVSINDNPQVGLRLEVSPRERAAFQAEGRTLVSRLKVALVQPGTAAVVTYDPRNLKRILVDSLDLEGAVPGSSETRLEELERLRDKGLITADEYRQKREEIIKSL